MFSVLLVIAMKFILLVNTYEKFPDVKVTARRREKHWRIFFVGNYWSNQEKTPWYQPIKFHEIVNIHEFQEQVSQAHSFFHVCKLPEASGIVKDFDCVSQCASDM